MSRTERLLVVLALNLGLVAVFVAVGVMAHSLAVLAEGGDYLLDAAGVGVALLAIRLSRRPAGGGRGEGVSKAPNVAALINAGWLLVLEVIVAAAAVGRLVTGTGPVDGLPVLVVSGIAALVMAGGAFILRGPVAPGRTMPADMTYRLRQSCSTPSRTPLPLLGWPWRAR
jgi:cobalt-zinc-cadmium efflux system protein